MKPIFSFPWIGNCTENFINCNCELRKRERETEGVRENVFQRYFQQIVIFIRVGRLNNRLLVTAATDGGNSIIRTFLHSLSRHSLFLKFDLVFSFLCKHPLNLLTYLISLFLSFPPPSSPE